MQLQSELKSSIITTVLHPINAFMDAPEWDGDRFKKWAEQIGNNTFLADNAILTSKRMEQQTYKRYMGLLKLTDKYTEQLLETVSEKH